MTTAKKEQMLRGLQMRRRIKRLERMLRRVLDAHESDRTALPASLGASAELWADVRKTLEGR